MSHAGGDPLHDPGLQPERTSLAWSRTILGYLVVATVCLKAVPHHGPASTVAAVAYLAAAVAIACSSASLHHRHVRGMHPGHSRPPLLEVLALSSVTAALSIHWLWLVVS